MALRIHAHWLHKAGNEASEYEDAFSYWCRARLSRTRYKSKGRLAVADGATDSWYSGLWADLLAHAGANGELDDAFLADTFEELRSEWKRRAFPEGLDWVSEAKARGGGHAAVLWAEIQSPADGTHSGTWTASAIGDSCLFHLRSGRLLTSFPYTRPDEFNSHPNLLGTNCALEQVTQFVHTTTGEWLPGDTILLATDAFALWFLEQVDDAGQCTEAGLADIIGAHSPTVFQTWVGQAREAGRLRNDDTTVLCVEVG